MEFAMVEADHTSENPKFAGEKCSELTSLHHEAGGYLRRLQSRCKVSEMLVVEAEGCTHCAGPFAVFAEAHLHFGASLSEHSHWYTHEVLPVI